MQLVTFTHDGRICIGAVEADGVRIAIEQIGELENPVVEEPDQTVCYERDGDTGKVFCGKKEMGNGSG